MKQFNQFNVTDIEIIVKNVKILILLRKEDILSPIRMQFLTRESTLKMSFTSQSSPDTWTSAPPAAARRTV